jgi:hypothetical protein
VSIEQKNDKGEWAKTNRSDGLGYIHYSPTGHMAVQIMPPNRKKYAADEPTPAEAAAALPGYTAYFGTFTVNEKEQYVVHHREGQVSPMGEVDAKRFYQFNGNRVTLMPAAADDPSKPGNNRLTWEKLADVPLSATAKQFVGFRRLLYTERTVQKAGAAPEKVRNTSQIGYIIYTSTGHLMVHMMQKERKKYAGQTPTPDEAKATITSYNAYMGRFTVNEAEKWVMHHRDGNLNAFRAGGEVKRFFAFDGPRLILTPEAAANTPGENSLIWELVSPTS